jgi:hypothetical protein
MRFFVIESNHYPFLDEHYLGVKEQINIAMHVVTKIKK